MSNVALSATRNLRHARNASGGREMQSNGQDDKEAHPDANRSDKRVNVVFGGGRDVRPGAPSRPTANGSKNTVWDTQGEIAVSDQKQESIRADSGSRWCSIFYF